MWIAKMHYYINAINVQKYVWILCIQVTKDNCLFCRRLENMWSENQTSCKIELSYSPVLDVTRMYISMVLYI